LLNLKNADIDVNATRRALLPSATLGLQYSSVGLAGNSPILSAPVPAAGAPVVDTTGTAVTVLDSNGNPIPIFIPTTTQTQVGLSNAGFGDAQSQIFHNNFPTYVASLNLQLPLRNRSAQADNQRAILAQRQMQTALQQLKNTIVLDVRQTYVALVQDRAQVDAAVKASELQKQTFEAEQKKYQLGASTVYNVILTQRDYVAAQGTELRALANLVEAKANYERALGRTLDVNHVSIADAKSGAEQKDTLIPGTLMNGQVVGVDELIRNLSSGNRK
jgi:outer membrane protein TolC